MDRTRAFIHPTNATDTRKDIPHGRHLPKPRRQRRPPGIAPPLPNRGTDPKQASAERKRRTLTLARVLDDVARTARELDPRHPMRPKSFALTRPAHVRLGQPNPTRKPKQHVIVRSATALHLQHPRIRVRVTPTLQPLRDALHKRRNVPGLPRIRIRVSESHHDKLRGHTTRSRQTLPSNIHETPNSLPHARQTPLAGQRGENRGLIPPPNLDTVWRYGTCFSHDKPRGAACGRAARAAALGRFHWHPSRTGLSERRQSPPQDAVDGQVLDSSTPASPPKHMSDTSPERYQRSRAQLFWGSQDPARISYILRIIYIM
jgi:hypothetical protein